MLVSVVYSWAAMPSHMEKTLNLDLPHNKEETDQNTNDILHITGHKNIMMN
jgi:hypothetical protein